MGRKRQWLDDDDSSEGSAGSGDENGWDNNNNDPDTRDEHELFSDPYKRKRQRRNGKEDAMLGVFADDDDDDRTSHNRRDGKKPQYSKPLAFVSKKTEDVNMENAEEDEAGDSEDDEEAEPDDAETSGDEESEDDAPPPEPRVIEEEDEAPSRPQMGRGGLGASKSAASMFAHFGAPQTQSSAAPSSSEVAALAGDEMPAQPPAPSRGGIGSSRKGIGSSRTAGADASLDSLPTSFGSPMGSTPQSNRPQRSFIRQDQSPAPAAANLTSAEKKHFDGLMGSSFGAKMMAKMGWQSGQGLGTNNQGIVNPIEAKLRPKMAGIAYQGFKEKTEQSKAEARRRGEVVSDDENEKARKAKKGKGKAAVKTQEDRSETWKKAPKKSKTKVTHMTYEEIVAGAEEARPSTLGQIIDATGATLREVSSIADISTASWIPSQEAERIPEIRHNLRLLVSSAKSDLDGLAREAKSLEERKKWVKTEDSRLKRIVDAEARSISRLQEINHIAEDISSKSKELAGSYDANLDIFSDAFTKLSLEYSAEYEQYQLDEVVVGAIAPYVRRQFAMWNPLQKPELLTPEFKKWRRLLRISASQEPSNVLIERHNMSTDSSRSKNPPRSNDMTSYESLMWNVWLPRVRSVINNDWLPSDPSPLIQLFEAWGDLIPPFMFDNVMDQLVMPKLSKAVSDWSLRTAEGVPLHKLVLPWLPHVGLRMDTLLEEAKRKLKGMLKSWTVMDGVPEGLIVWREVLKTKEWDDLLLKYVVPKLGAHLREKLVINPADQDMEPLYRTAPWVTVLKPSVYSQLLEMEFFPKWLATLHSWLSQSSAQYDEVADWYAFWKGSFSEAVLELSGVKVGFTKALQLMNTAAGMKPVERRYLPKPTLDFRPAPAPSSKAPSKAPSTTAASMDEEVSFKTIVEENVAKHNLLLLPLGRAHQITRLPLYKIAAGIDGKGGATVYFMEDVTHVMPVGGVETELFQPTSLADLVARILKK
ncbi:TFP11-domain-containing protein [Clavulina sp. PMI_390]|nr:TFP11-domain-containing protein [Clavulina sp. PMI_390]